MDYLTMARIKIAGKTFIVCDCRLLENVEGCTKTSIEKMANVSVLKTDNFKVLNPNQDFVSDLNKIMNKISQGDESRYYRGDFGKYYITDYEKIVAMYNNLEAKSFGSYYGNKI